MKKAALKLFSFILKVSLVTGAVFAGGNGTSSKVISRERIDLPDGGYVIEEIVELETGARASGSKTGTKTTTRYSSSNVPLFSVVVTGKFTYTGTTSYATYSAATVNILNSSVSYVSKSASYSGNTATATGKASYAGTTMSRTVNLSCSASGVLS